MLFDIFQYNIPLALATFFLFLILFGSIFQKQIVTLADPLVFHMLWLASQATFLVIYGFKNGLSLIFLFFALTLAVYVLALIGFFNFYHKKENARLLRIEGSLKYEIFSKKQILLLLISSTALLSYSYVNFFQYAITCSSVADLFLYRFIDLQGRDGLQRIASSVSPVFLMSVFYGIHKNIYKKIAIILLVAHIILGMLSGGRSILLLTIAAAGMYFFYFRNHISLVTKNRFNKYVVVAAAFALVAVVFITSFYESDSDFQTASLVVFNRIFAAPDGVEYYLKFDGIDRIPSGLFPYLNSIFGLYIKNIMGIDIKNIGWQLTELAVGSVDFAQGSNYTVLLQAMVFGVYVAPLYAALIAWIVAKFRYSFARKPVLVPFFYSLSSFSFIVATDLEYFVFLMSSLSVLYILIYIPILRLRVV